MIKIEYNPTSHEDFFRHFSRSLKLKTRDNTIFFSPGKGAGLVKFINLSAGMQLMIYDYISLQDLLYHHKKSDKELLVLNLSESTSPDNVTRSSVFLSNTRREWLYLSAANNHLRQISIIFSKSWLDDYLTNEKKEELLGSYIIFKSSYRIYELMDAKYKRLVDEILNLQTDTYFEQMIIGNRIALIIEHFFTRLYADIESGHPKLKILPKELRSIKMVESELVKDFSQAPPSILQLARIASMNQSRMKTLFKNIFKLSINQYYQKQRMDQANVMLLSKKYLVGDVTNALGFSSIGSFNKAFCKTFGHPPVDSSTLSKK